MGNKASKKTKNSLLNVTTNDDDLSAMLTKMSKADDGSDPENLIPADEGPKGVEVTIEHAQKRGVPAKCSFDAQTSVSQRCTDTEHDI